MLRQPIGGSFLSAHIKNYFDSQDIEIKPHYMIKQKAHVAPGQPANAELRTSLSDIRPSYHAYQQERIVLEFKESTCQLLETSFNDVAGSARPGRPFEFPDGYNLVFGSERFKLPEILFNPQQFATPQVPAPDNSIGIAQMLYNSVVNCDPDVRGHLLQNIIITGGGSLLQGFTDRVALELQKLAPGNKIRLHTPGTSIERKAASWIGGSILASLGTFHALWISKQEYEEVSINYKQLFDLC